MQCRQKKVVSFLLHHLEPELFPEEPADDAWFKGMELDLLCFALRVHQEALLPTETHDMDTTIPALSAVISQQYRAMGSPFAQVPANEPERLLEGYFPVEGKTVTCALDTKAYKTMVEFHYADSIRVGKPPERRDRRAHHGWRPRVEGELIGLGVRKRRRRIADQGCALAGRTAAAEGDG